MSSEENGFGLRIINFAKGQVLPTFKENRNGKWVDYGDNNLYPQYLLDVYQNRSNKHKAIINRKVEMTTGQGIKDPVTRELEKFLKNQYGKYDIEELSIKCNFDFEIYGGFSLNVRWNIDGTRIAGLDYIPFQKCRLSPCEEYILISKDWSQFRRKENYPEEHCVFNPHKAKEYPSQVFYFIADQVGQEYYPIPYYSSTMNWIEMDGEISSFHLNSIRNGFMPSFILNFSTGIPTREQMDDAYKEFTNKYTGADNAGKFILTFSEGADQKPELLPINLNDSDERFIMLHAEMKEEIFVGHGVVSPMLFGIRTEGSLGGRDEMLEALAIFQSTYVTSRQKVMEKQFNKLAKWAGAVEEIEYNEYKLDFEQIDGQEVPEERIEEEVGVEKGEEKEIV
jgi:hypothetical protein